MNWDDLRIVLSVAKMRSVRKAAIALNVHYTTVSRRIEAFEKKIGLFRETAPLFAAFRAVVGRWLCPPRRHFWVSGF